MLYAHAYLWFTLEYNLPYSIFGEKPSEYGANIRSTYYGHSKMPYTHLDPYLAIKECVIVYLLDAN